MEEREKIHDHQVEIEKQKKKTEKLY